MKKISTVAAGCRRNIAEQKLTIGLGLGGRSSWYCALDECGAVLLAQRVSTTPKAMREVPQIACRMIGPRACVALAAQGASFYSGFPANPLIAEIRGEAGWGY